MEMSKKNNKVEEKKTAEETEEGSSYEDQIEKAENIDTLIAILDRIPNFFKEENKDELKEEFKKKIKDLKKEVEARKEDEAVVGYEGFNFFTTEYGLRKKIRELLLGDDLKEEIENKNREEQETEEEKANDEKEEQETEEEKANDEKEEQETEEEKANDEKEEEERKKEKEAQENKIEEKEMLYSTKIDLMEDLDEDKKEELKNKVRFVNKEKIAEECQGDFEELLKLFAQKEGEAAKKKKEEKKGAKGEKLEEDKDKEEDRSDEQIEINFEELPIEGEGKYQGKIEEMSKKLGLPVEEIEQIVNQQKANLVELTAQQAKKKEKKWKKIGKTLGIYAVLGGGLGLLTGGLGVGIGLAAGRIVDTVFKGKKTKKGQEKAEQEVNEILLKTKEVEGEADKEEDEDTKNVLDSFYDNIFTELSLAKRNQIESQNKEKSKLGKEISQLEESYRPEDKEKLADLYQKRRQQQKEKIKDYLKAKGLEGEELEKRVKLSVQLVELDDNQKIMELDFAQRKASKVIKIFNKLDSILNHPALLGGAKQAESQNKEKIITASIFAVAGVLARSCPIVRNVLMAYAGMKLGSVAADLMFSKSKELREISSEQLSLESSVEDLNRAKAQLLDPKYKEKNPLEYAKLQEKIFAIDRARMEKVLGGIEEIKKEEEVADEKSEESGSEEGRVDRGEEIRHGYIARVNQGLEEAIKKRRAAQGAHKGMKIFLGIAGGAAGWFLGEYMNEQNKAREEAGKEAQTKKVEEAQKKELDAKNSLDEQIEKSSVELRAQEEQMNQMELEKIAKLNQPVVVEKGDTVWGVCEEQLEKRVDGWGNLNQAEKDYLIDWYKDKVVANPAEYGIDGGNASSLKIGSKIEVADLFKDQDEINEALDKARGLSSEQVQNIMNNRELIGNVMSQKLEEVPGDKLLEAVRVMGGTDQAGPGFVDEIEKRATEVLGEVVTPDQTQTILNNPEIFGEIMTTDGNLTEVPDKILRRGLELMSGEENMTVGELQREVIVGKGKIQEELWARLKDLQDKLHQNFGENIGINEIASSGGLGNTPRGQEIKETWDNLFNQLDEQKEEIIKLKEKPGLLRKIFTNPENKIKELSRELKQNFGDLQINHEVQKEFIKTSEDLAKKYKELTGGDFFEAAVENYENDYSTRAPQYTKKVKELTEFIEKYLK
jgi:hypothetical protein